MGSPNNYYFLWHPWMEETASDRKYVSGHSKSDRKWSSGGDRKHTAAKYINNNTSTKTTPTPPPEKSTEAVSVRESSGSDCLMQALPTPSGLSDDEKGKALKIVSRLPSAQAQAVLDEMEGALRSNRIKSNRLGWLRKVTESAAQGTFSPELGVRVAEERRLRVRREAQIHAPQPKSWQEELVDQELERKATSARAEALRRASVD